MLNPHPTRRLILALALAATAALAGCATAPGPQFSALKAAEPESASVYVYRRERFFAGGQRFKVDVDAKPVGEIFNASFLQLNLEPGKHLLTVKPGGLAKDFSLEINTAPGKTYFAEFDLNGGPLANAFFIGSELLERPQEKALEDLKTLKAAK
jgi:hypothetical protein